MTNSDALPVGSPFELRSVGADFAWRLGVALAALEVDGWVGAWDGLLVAAEVWAWGEEQFGR